MEVDLILPRQIRGGMPVVTVDVSEVDVQFLRVKNERLPDFLDRVITRRKSNRTQDQEEESPSADSEEYDYRRPSFHDAIGV